MSAEENRAIARRWSEEVWNQGNMAAFDDIVADDFIAHDANAPTGTLDKAAYRQWILDVRSAFPDLRFSIEGLYADGDYVVWRSVGSGTQQGPFLGIPPTGRSGQARAVDTLRFSGGKCHEVWEQWDALSLFQQLGVLPSLEQIIGALSSQRPPEGPTPGAAPH